jgi:acetyl-CoA carboxylase biotin carboxylase subunit
VIRACHKLGLETVAVYSEADRDALHVRLATQAVCIGPPPSRESYLKVVRVLSAAEITECDAVHPGYGFLSENAQFAEACEASGFVFIGPPPQAIASMGDKSVARETVQRAGAPIMPGSDGPVASVADARKIAQHIGFPVIVKASAGGGGRGMRVARSPDELEKMFATAQAEAGAAFGRSDVYLEKYLERARHVEIQVLADAHGHCVYLGERDCSTQRRHQKLIEESPSPALTAELRRQMGEAAVKAAQAVGYRSAGTVECLVGQDGFWCFMEMNTRLQVEHPVTEMVTGVDIVEQQLRIAQGEPLPFRQEDIQIRGHAIECRINAEDPAHGFRPCPGLVEKFSAPNGCRCRVDTHLYDGYRVPAHYDSLIAKVITHGEDRATAIGQMDVILRTMQIDGVATTIPFHLALLADPAFREGRVHTQFVEKEFLPAYRPPASA